MRKPGVGGEFLGSRFLMLQSRHFEVADMLGFVFGGRGFKLLESHKLRGRQRGPHSFTWDCGIQRGDSVTC